MAGRPTLQLEEASDLMSSTILVALIGRPSLTMDAPFADLCYPDRCS